MKTIFWKANYFWMFRIGLFSSEHNFYIIYSKYVKKVLKASKNYLTKMFCDFLIIWSLQTAWVLKTGDLKTIQIWIQLFFDKKIRNCVYLFTCILPDYMAHGITKQSWKNIHSEKMTAVFLLRCQNLLRWNAPEIMHFKAWHFLSLSILPLQ